MAPTKALAPAAPGSPSGTGTRITDAITASAKRLERGDRNAARRLLAQRREWQGTAFDYFATLPEVSNASTYLGNALSKIRLYVGVKPETPGLDPVDIGNPEALARSEVQVPQSLIDEATGVFSAFRPPDGEGDIGDLQRDIGINWEITGECFLIEDAEGFWDVLSIRELTVTKEGKYLRKEDPSDKGTELASDPIRMWVRDPEWGGLAWSPMKAVLDVAEELLILTRAVRAAGVSLIAGAGLLLIPKGMLFGWNNRPNAGNGEERENPFLDDLLTYMMTPIQDEGAASATVPMPLIGERDDIAAVKHLPLSRPMDQWLDQRTQTTLKRLATGLNRPAEMLTGAGNASHWSLWFLGDEGFTAYTQPTTERMCSTITAGMLRPRLAPRSDFDLSRIVIWYDAADLVVRPNRAQDAKDAWDRGGIGTQPLRKYLNFEESDAPTPEDIALLLALRGSAPDPTVGSPASGGGSDDSGQPNGSAPGLSASGVPNPGERLADLDRSLRERLQVACDAAMRRALERAGSRARSLSQKHQSARAIAASAPVERIVSTLGPALVAAVGLTDDDLLEGAFAGIEAEYETWTERTQREARRALGLPADDTEALREDRREGWLLLLAALMTVGRMRLYDPTPQAPEEGEFDPLNLVPPNVVRSSLARAGGQVVDATERFTQPPMGVATGPAVMGEAMAAGWANEGWIWETGAPAFPFEPHHALAGVEVSSLDDPALANTHGWPYNTPTFFPGDHPGDECSLVPLLAQQVA